MTLGPYLGFALHKLIHILSSTDLAGNVNLFPTARLSAVYCYCIVQLNEITGVNIFTCWGRPQCITIQIHNVKTGQAILAVEMFRQSEVDSAKVPLAQFFLYGALGLILVGL